MDGKRSFKVVVSEVGEDFPVALLRCPECGSKQCKIMNVTSTNGNMQCNPDLRGGFIVHERDDDMPKTNGVNIHIACEEGHHFWYWFHTAGFTTVITHGLIGESADKNIGGSNERRI